MGGEGGRGGGYVVIWLLTCVAIIIFTDDAQVSMYHSLTRQILSVSCFTTNCLVCNVNHPAISMFA